MEKRTHWKEIRNTHFVTEADITANEGDIFASICIDAWETEHDWEEGKVIAEVILSKHGDILVSYRDPLARVDEAAQAAIEEAKQQLRKYWEEQREEPEHTMARALECLGAEAVFLKKGQKPIESRNNAWDGCYQFMRKEASQICYFLNFRLRRLKGAGVMSENEVQEIMQKTYEKLVQEYAEVCPPPEGKHYEFAGLYCDEPMLRIVDENI